MSDRCDLCDQHGYIICCSCRQIPVCCCGDCCDTYGSECPGGHWLCPVCTIRRGLTGSEECRACQEGEGDEGAS